MGISTSYAQKFTLKDSVFKNGDVLITYSVTFDLNNSDIKPESFLFLDSVASFLIHNKNVTLEISNHCDERWSDKSSTCLTCKRAKAIVEYLILKGVESDRLVAVGYNDKKPLIKGAKTEEEHQKNRRSEFKILRTDF